MSARGDIILNRIIRWDNWRHCNYSPCARIAATTLAHHSSQYRDWTCSVLIDAHEYARRRFRKYPLWRAFFEKFAFSVDLFTGYVCTEGKKISVFKYIRIRVREIAKQLDWPHRKMNDESGVATPQRKLYLAVTLSKWAVGTRQVKGFTLPGQVLGGRISQSKLLVNTS